MPVKECRKDGKPGFKWGDEGKCYTYTANDSRSRQAAYDRALRQGRAIKAREGK